MLSIFLQLKEQILQAEQSYSSVLEGMKMEISQLTRELHQQDITIASTKSSSSDMEKRLKAEIQKAEEKAVEHKVKRTKIFFIWSLFLKVQFIKGIISIVFNSVHFY